MEQSWQSMANRAAAHAIGAQHSAGRLGTLRRAPVVEELWPPAVVVALEAYEVLVAGIGGVQLLRVMDFDEGVADAVAKEGRDEGLGDRVHRRHLRM